ncbi:unnamed protein product [Penicillium pancosmium]
MTPDAIPIEYLDQVNLAFVYIDPKDYSIIGMDDSSIAADVYAKVADLKTRKPDAEIWVSVGGWTFNDAGIYQSVFPSIAKDTAVARQFIGNLMEFLDKFGFDGVDLDWEYPGADDRGGSEEDIENYPKLLGQMRRYLKGGNNYSKSWGISITVPTSYWYLRWFDINQLQHAVDTFNLMAYDLHGRWDRDDPIGPYVYAHTNLTEIDDALDLFWRNDIDPSKISLGLAFYGRTYTLKTPLCSEPGCEWTDPGPQGGCTGTAGILSYKEIKEKIVNADLSPVYDEEAGVYYLMYGDGGGYWVSFDDAISFRAKIDLANKYGLGGLLIWAIDQDDDYYHALRGVVGKDVVPLPTASKSYGAFDLEECYITPCGIGCATGDSEMTKLNEDSSGRGCGGSDHNARSFCCPPRTAPDASTCYWTGGPKNCHGQCKAGEVSMVLDDYGDSGKRCTNGGKKVWCCPATNGQAAIEDCSLADVESDCPKDKPQEMTSVGSFLRDTDGLGWQFKRKLCCPSKPDFHQNKCDWYGDDTYCNDSECPLGQVELFRWNGWHEGESYGYRGCNKGRQQAYCCPPPLSNGSAFLPVPLQDLFPTGDSFPDSYTTTFAEHIDNSYNELSADVQSTDPNKKAFTWVIMTGDQEDVQSFEKRDGSHLELFDCTDTKPDDFDTQTLKATCVGGTSEDNNCEDILLGGVEGTVVRLPANCGPDTYVRAVSFKASNNSTLPHSIQKRHPDANKVYEFRYDYEFKKLRRDGGEIYFRADLSNHPGYWDEIVAASPDSPVKRSAENWRHLDRRFWSSSWEDWQKRFNSLLTKGNEGLKKHYEFNQCLFEAKGVCKNADIGAKAFVYGEFNTTMDLGMSLIGTLKNFGFSESYAYFNQEAFSMRMGAGFEARARMYFDSGWASMGSFEPFGMNSFIKGIFTINPYFKMDARVEADAYISAQATGEISISHERFRYYLPVNLGNNPTEITGDWDLSSVTGPISGLGDIEAKAGGGLVLGFRPSIGIDINLQLQEEEYVNTSITLSTPGSIRYDAAISSKCSAGMQFDVTGKLDVEFAVTNALPGWSSKSYNWENPNPATLYSGCVPFDVLLGRDLDGQENNLTSRSTIGSNIDLPDRSDVTCAFSTKGVYCADENNDLDCDLSNLPDDDGDGDKDEDEISMMKRSNLQKRSTKELGYCMQNPKTKGQYEGFNTANIGMIKFSNFPSSGELVKTYPNVATYDASDPKDCNNLDLIKLAKTPTKPGIAASNNGRQYDSEHVLEAQTVQRFFKDCAQKWSQLNDKGAKTNPNIRNYEDPQVSKNAKINIPWCQWMSLWWQKPAVFPGGLDANSYLGSVYPGYHGHFTDEMVLLASDMNSKVKQGWFGGLRPYGEGSIDSHMQKGNWDNISKYLKLHILCWKYYYLDEIKTTLVKQANRIQARLKELEAGGLIDSTVGDFKGKYDRKYKSQGFEDLWKTWVRSEHTRVQETVKKFLKDKTTDAYNLNRPTNAKLQPGQAHQKDDKIVKMFEMYLDEVNNLKDWDIDWDKKI